MSAIMDGYSSLPPNAPPVSICTTRILSSGRPHSASAPYERSTDTAASPDGDSIFRVERRDDSIVFDVQLFLRAVKYSPSMMCALLPDGVYVAFLHEVAFKSVVGAPDDYGLLLAFFHGVHGRERLVVDGHRSTAFRTCDGLHGQKENRLFGVIHCIGSEAMLVFQDQSDAVLPGMSLAVTMTNSPMQCSDQRNLSDLAPRYAAAHSCAVKHAGQNHIVDVARRSRDLVPASLRGTDAPTM